MVDGVKALFDVNKKHHNKFTLDKGFILIINYTMETSCGKVFFKKCKLIDNNQIMLNDVSDPFFP